MNDQSRAEIRDRFNAAKLLQTDINAWLDCAYKQCGLRKTCLGGPRGTSLRTGGWPACTPEGQARLRENRKNRKWQRTALYEAETISERSLRRTENELNELDIFLKKSGI